MVKNNAIHLQEPKNTVIYNTKIQYELQKPNNNNDIYIYIIKMC